MTKCMIEIVGTLDMTKPRCIIWLHQIVHLKRQALVILKALTLIKLVSAERGDPIWIVRDMCTLEQ